MTYIREREQKTKEKQSELEASVATAEKELAEAKVDIKYLSICIHASICIYILHISIHQSLLI